MTPPDIDQLVAIAGQHAHRLLVEEHEAEIVPCFQLWRGNHMALALAPWQDADDKTAMMTAVRKLAAEFHADRVCLLTEAWVARYRLAEPAQTPEQQECVLAAATDGRRSAYRLWEIVRAVPDGWVEALVEQPAGPGIWHASMLEEILQPVRIH